MGWLIVVICSVSEPEPGAVEPPYFAGAGAVILVKNGSGSGLDKWRDFFTNYNLVTLFCHVQMPFLSFSSPFVSKIELLKPSKVKNKKYFLWGKQYVEFFLILGWSRSRISRNQTAPKRWLFVFLGRAEFGLARFGWIRVSNGTIETRRNWFILAADYVFELNLQLHRRKIMLWFLPGSNRRPCPCEGNVITTTLRNLLNREAIALLKLFCSTKILGVYVTTAITGVSWRNG